MTLKDIITALALISCSISFISVGFKKLKLLRLIENTPTSKIRSLAIGPAEIYGTVYSNKEIIAPFSQKKCIYCEWYIYEKEKNEDLNNKRLYSKNTGTLGVLFYIKDLTGKILVNPRDSIIKTSKKFSTTSVSKKIEKFLEENKIKYYDGYIFEEIRIESNDKFYILGAVKNINKHYVKNEDGLIIEKGQFPMYISDKNEFDIRKHLKTSFTIYISLGTIFLIISIGYLISIFGG